MKCKECGRQIPDGALFCKYCGAAANAGGEDTGTNGRRLDFEKKQKGVRRGAAKKRGNGLIIGLAAVLIVAIGVLAAVLIWKNGTGDQKPDAQVPPAAQQNGEEEQTDWTASILPRDGEVEVGENMMLNAAVDQDMGSVSVRSVTWQTSDSKIATVSDGIVYGISAGEVTITASLALSDGSSVQAEAAVTVVEASVVYTATLTPDSATLKLGDSTTLVADLEQDLKAGVEVVSTVWSSDNKDVAVVSNGKVSAVGAGTATISVTINLSNAQAASANAKITVTAPEQTQNETTTQNNNQNNNQTNNNTNNNNQNTGNTNQGGSTNQGGGTYSTYNDYVLPGSDTSVYSYDVLRSLSAWELRVARNEIFARHGRLFEDAALQSHFNMKSWYKGYLTADQFDANVLNSVELENIARIKAVEAER